MKALNVAVLPLLSYGSDYFTMAKNNTPNCRSPTST